MDDSFGDWYRAADLIPNHDDLVNRQAAIEAFTADCSSDRIVELSQCFFDLASDSTSISDMQQAMKEVDAAFQMQDNAIELRVLAGACLIEFLGGSNGMLSALALVPPSLMGSRDKILVPDICQRASEFLDTASLQLRTPEGLSTGKVSATRIEDELVGINEAGTSNAFNVGSPYIAAALKSLHTTINGLVRKCNKLERNQQVFREDSDILWWMTGGHSRDLQQPLSEIDPTGVAAVLGKELADLICVLPGPFAVQAILDRCLNDCDVKTKPLSLSQLVNKIPSNWKESWKDTLAGNDDLLTLCPVACAVLTSVNITGERNWHAPFKAATGIKPSFELAPVDWAYQTYRECILIAVRNTLS